MISESKRLKQEILDLQVLTQAVKARNRVLKMELEKMQKEDMCHPLALTSIKKIG